MAYTKHTWEDGVTALSAEHFNHMETGIKDAHDALTNVYTKDETYQKSEVYGKSEAVAKDDIKVINLSFSVPAGARGTIYTTNLTNIDADITNANNWALISAQHCAPGGEGWMDNALLVTNMQSGGSSVLTDAKLIPTIQVYNESGSVKAKYSVYNSTNSAGTFKFRLVFLKIA